MLFTPEGSTWSSCRARAFVLEHVWKEGQPPLTLAVGVALGFERPSNHIAFLDTGARHSLLSREIAEGLGDDVGPSGERITYSTRFGRVSGALHRLPLSVIVEEGIAPSTPSVPFFIPAPHEEDWRGVPVILGMQGFLEHLRFALDPAQYPGEASHCYFGVS